jgi:hypothetical protein
MAMDFFAIFRNFEFDSRTDPGSPTSSSPGRNRSHSGRSRCGCGTNSNIFYARSILQYVGRRSCNSGRL